MNSRSIRLLAAGAALVALPALGSPLTQVFQRVQSSVVVIETAQKDIDPGFPGQVVTVGGMGSGVLITDDGKILTAAHVVQAADRIEVTFLSGERIPARVLGSEPVGGSGQVQRHHGDAVGMQAGAQLHGLPCPDNA